MKTPICIAFKAHMGWVNAAAVLLEAKKPEPVFARRIDLVEGDREVVEPYHVAGGWHGLKQQPRPADPEGIIRRGRARQEKAAHLVLEDFRKELAGRELDWQRAVMLTTRAWLGHDLEGILSSHSHIHVYEGEAIRDATRSALKALSIPCADQDEKSILESSNVELAVGNADEYMKDRRPHDTRSWSKEERLVALGAWLNRV